MTKPNRQEDTPVPLHMPMSRVVGTEPPWHSGQLDLERQQNSTVLEVALTLQRLFDANSKHRLPSRVCRAW
eukprot:CAMPEP_0206433870 /NCGR_PEP_ID=MMETSP0324_2-20121206/8780_1 /ASSEMBLY_ACC=CAM_ASM_000836 /TAXON_ID=2866 /ORGANISM="Crypthecodinium cohnii, Strain Seligo" /LENGTH=70 /DNA_ID=CAMNT_0053900197 /DNA_START=167 /DNA_END=376 /DNA_ORIENTATION=+